MNTCEHQWAHFKYGPDRCLLCDLKRVVINGESYAVDEGGYLSPLNEAMQAGREETP